MNGLIYTINKLGEALAQAEEIIESQKREIEHLKTELEKKAEKQRDQDL